MILNSSSTSAALKCLQTCRSDTFLPSECCVKQHKQYNTVQNRHTHTLTHSVWVWMCVYVFFIFFLFDILMPPNQTFSLDYSHSRFVFYRFFSFVTTVGFVFFCFWFDFFIWFLLSLSLSRALIWFRINILDFFPRIYIYYDLFFSLFSVISNFTQHKFFSLQFLNWKVI